MYILLATYVLNLYSGVSPLNYSEMQRYIRKVPIVQTFDKRQDCEETLFYLRNTVQAVGQCKKMHSGEIFK